MYSEDKIKKMRWKVTFSFIKVIILFATFIASIFISMSTFTHILGGIILLYFTIKYIFIMISSIREIQKLENPKYQKPNFGFSDDMNKILEDLLKERFKEYYQKQQNQQTNSFKLRNAYSLLKLKPESSIQEIKTRYRELAFKWHPDKWINTSVSNQTAAKRNFQKLQAAYELIKKDKGI